MRYLALVATTLTVSCTATTASTLTEPAASVEADQSSHVGAWT